jgi:hypothetical protein
MKQRIFFFLITVYLLQINEVFCQSSKANLLGVFDGRTPCQELAKQISEQVSTECIKIKWRLTLYNDASGNPGTYELIGFVHKKENPAVGKWRILRGTATDKNAIVYQIDLQGKEPLFLLKADDNILFFLDKEKRLMVGNKDFSYTLNRKKEL